MQHNMYSTLAEAIINNNAIQNKGVTFIDDSGQNRYLSYSSLFEKSLSLSSYYHNEIKLLSGDKLIFQVDNNYDFIINFWACILIGVIPIPLTYANNDETITKLYNVWKIADCSKIVMTEKLKKRLQGKSDKRYSSSFSSQIISLELIITQYDLKNKTDVYTPKPNDIAFIQFSSGSTGSPKGVMLTHKNIISNVNQMGSPNHWSKNDVALSWMPLTHDMGIIGMHITPTIFQCNQYLMSTFLFSFNPLSWLTFLDKYKVTITACPNFGYSHVLKFLDINQELGLNLSRLRYILNGAEPISYTVCQKFLEKFRCYGLCDNAILPVYGLAECTLAVTKCAVGEKIKAYSVLRSSINLGTKVILKPYTNENDHRYTTLVDLGDTVDKVQISIRDKCGNVLPEERTGLVYVKGKGVTKGYYNNKEATKESISKDNFFNTGDLGFLRKGRLILIGREKEVFIINGQNYYSNDIERIINEFDEKCDRVAIIGIQNHEKEEAVIFIQTNLDLKDFINLSEGIKNIVLTKTGIEIVNVIPIKKIPITTSGKPQRYILKENYLKGEYSSIINDINQIVNTNSNSTILLSTNNIEKRIAELWKNATGKNIKFSVEDNFFEAGVTSLLISQIGNELQKEYPGIISTPDLFNYPSIKMLAGYIQMQINNNSETIEFSSISEKYVTSTLRMNRRRIIKANFCINNLYQYCMNNEYDISNIIISALVVSFNKYIVGNDRNYYVDTNNQTSLVKMRFPLELPENFRELFEEISKQRGGVSYAGIANLEDLQFYNGKSIKNVFSICFLKEQLGLLNDVRKISDNFDIVISYSISPDHCTIKSEFINLLNESLEKSIIQSFVENISYLDRHSSTLMIY